MVELLHSYFHIVPHKRLLLAPQELYTCDHFLDIFSNSICAPTFSLPHPLSYVTSALSWVVSRSQTRKKGERLSHIELVLIGQGIYMGDN